MFHDVDDVVDGGEILERSFSPKFTTAVWAKSISCVAVRGVGRREFCRTAVVATVAFFCWSRTRVLPESKCSLWQKAQKYDFHLKFAKRERRRIWLLRLEKMTWARQIFIFKHHLLNKYRCHVSPSLLWQFICWLCPAGDRTRGSSDT